ncbi:MAG: tetratricopeptide repeat protein [Gammaproteobacteria bacterium]|nr:tetratricopeptide repeat protein [Gammaproteobacteria bacterium]MDH4254076.1 tetratricopeptide repeat protein [Gammaproteobacteria bacterium]MDH5310482.1 tetratricopeptide repeat protein [Gammaproteobacteria bacterium]
MTFRDIAAAAAILFLLQSGTVRGEEPALGSISFPNSGSAEAQSAFLTGVKALHSFQFDEARMAFEEAQRIDPSFALAYWGQAMSDNHPLWAQQDIDAAATALTRLARTFQERLAKAPTDKEKAYLQAIEILYFSPGDKLTRDLAYADAMARMHARWPRDHEIAIFYSLSLLGTVRPGDRGFRRQALAASIAQQVFASNPKHPGAAHFIIHSFDDPDHAVLALPAAEVYADIAPAAAHALHMPSHIFLQLGMWQRVVDSNVDAYAAAVANNEKYGLPEGREDFHTLSWLAYANLMLGHSERAEENLSRARAAVDRNPGVGRVYDGYLEMQGRHIVESGDWRDLELAPAETSDGGNPYWVSVVGMSAAQSGRAERASAAEARLRQLAGDAEANGKSYDAMLIAILEKQVAALRLLVGGDAEAAVALASEAADLEVGHMRVPSGPPRPMKPAAELYGDVLMAAGRPADAVAAYERALDWIPQRTPSLLGLAQAALASGDRAMAMDTYARLRDMPGANPDGPAVRAAVAALSAAGD